MYRLRTWFICIAMFCIAGVSSSAQTIICRNGFFQADMGVDSKNWQEGFWGFAGEKGLKVKSGSGGHIFAVLHNSTDKPIEVNVKGLSIDNLKFEDAYAKGKIVWWKVRINPIPAGGDSEFVMRFRKKPADNVKIALDTSAGRIKFSIVAKQINYFWQSIAWSKKDGKLFLYLSTPLPELVINDLLIDGLSVNKNTQWRKIRGLGNRTVLLAVVDLKSKWYQGQIHRISLKFDDGRTNTRFYRAVDSKFIYFSYGYGTGGKKNKYNRYGVDTHINFRPYNKKGLDALSQGNMQAVFSVKPEEAAKLNGHKAFYGCYLMDEPDCKDYAVKKFPHKLRIGYHARKIIPLENEFTLSAPRALVYLTIDNTYKPTNWYTYGQIGDVVSTDPYCLLIGEQPSWAVRAITQAFYGAAPKPLWAIIDAFYPPKKKDAKFPRFASPEELRQTAYYCLASGARGLGYYINCTSGKFTGWNDNPHLQHAIKQISEDLKTIGPLLARGSPVDLLRYKNDSIYARSILAGENSIVVVLVNHAMHSEKIGPVIPSIDPSSTIDVLLPKWWKVKRVSAKFAGPGLENERVSLKVTQKKDARFVRIPLKYSLHVAEAIVLEPNIEELRAMKRKDAIQKQCLKLHPPLRLIGHPIHGYYYNASNFFPLPEKYNAIDCWERKGDTNFGAEYKVSISPEMAGKKYTLTLQFRASSDIWNAKIKHDGKTLPLKETEKIGMIHRFPVGFPEAGDYLFVISTGKMKTKREHGMRLGKEAFLIPMDKRSISD